MHIRVTVEFYTYEKLYRRLAYDWRFSNLGVVFTDMDGSPYSSASQMRTLTPNVRERAYVATALYPRVTNACIAPR